MTRTIKITTGMSDFFVMLNSTRPYHEQKNNVLVSSSIPNKLISILCPDGTCLGKDLNETVSVGSIAEVSAGTAQIVNDVADKLIEQGFVEEV